MGSKRDRRDWMSRPNRLLMNATRNRRGIEQRMERRRTVLTYYGSGSYACVICGQNDPDVLSLDHINESMPIACRLRTAKWSVM